MTGTYVIEALGLVLGVRSATSDASGGLSPAGTIWVALGVALISLGGSVFVAFWNGRSMNEVAKRNADAMIAAENTRAANALAAQEAQAAAEREAEDRRHALAIEAEDRRHENALALANRARTIESRHALYVAIEGPRSAAENLARRFRMVTHPSNAPLLAEERSTAAGELDEAAKGLRSLVDEAALYASEEVAKQLRALTGPAVLLQYLASNPRSGEEQELVDTATTLIHLSTRLLRTMREELGASPKAHQTGAASAGDG